MKSNIITGVGLYREKRWLTIKKKTYTQPYRPKVSYFLIEAFGRNPNKNVLISDTNYTMPPLLHRTES